MSDTPCELQFIKAGRYRDDPIAAVIVAHNETERLEAFFAFYRSIGVRNFWFIDNGSDDGMHEALREQDDVTLYRTTANYSDHRKGLRWSRAISDAFLEGKWVFTLDVDELFVWPGFGNVTLSDFVEYLEANGFQTVFSLMADFFPRPGAWKSFRGSTDMFADAPCLIVDNLEATPARHFPLLQVRGGIRKVITPGDQTPPIIHKMPLIKWDRSRYYLKSTHYLSRAVPIADVVCSLAHFKFSGESQAKFELEIARGQRWQGGAQYKAYANALADTDSLYTYPNILEVGSPKRLEQAGLLRSSNRFVRHFADRLGDDQCGRRFNMMEYTSLLDNWGIYRRFDSPEFETFLDKSFAFDVENVSVIGGPVGGALTESYAGA